MTEKVRLSATVDSDLLAAAQQSVDRGCADSVSAWVNDALRAKADRQKKLDALDEYLSQYEAEHGEITDQELEATLREMRAQAVVVRTDSAHSEAPSRAGRRSA